MSNLDLPTPPALQIQHQSSSKQEQITSTYQSKNSDSDEPLFLQSHNDLQNTLELRYISDLDRWKAKTQESNLKRDIAEKEYNRLEEELHFWKTKSESFNKQKALEAELQLQLKKNEAKISQTNSQTTSNNLSTEIDLLNNKIQEKVKEIEDIKKFGLKKDTKKTEIKKISDIQMRAYETQLKLLKKEIQQKIDQSIILQRENEQLSKSSNKLTALKKEVREIKTLLGLKFEESQKLKFEVSKQQIENISIKKNEQQLKDKENGLLVQISDIQNKIQSQRQLKEVENEIVDKANLQELEELKSQHQRDKEALQQKKLSYSCLLEEKQQNVNNLSKNLEELKVKIGDAKLKQQSVKGEVNELQEHLQSIQVQKEQEVSRIAEEREKSVESLKKSYLLDKSLIESKIDFLREDLNQKQEFLNQSSSSLARSRLEKNQLELEKRKLQAQLDLKKLQEQEQEKNFSLQLEVKEKVYEKTVQTLRSHSEYEKEKLAEQEKALESVCNMKSIETLEAKEISSKYLSNSIIAENKEREKSLEAEAWKNTFSIQEREKSIETQIQRDLRRSQVEQLKKSHEQDLLIQELNNSVLQNVLLSKQQEASALFGSTKSLANELEKIQQASRNAEIEASLWKSKAELEEVLKELSLKEKEQILQEELDRFKNQKLVEDQIKKNKIPSLLSSVSAKDREATIWRQNYKHLYSTSFFK